MVKNSMLLYFNTISGFLFAVIMVLKYGFTLVPAMFLLWPTATMISSYFWEKHKLKNYNRHVHYTVDGNERVNGIVTIIIHPVAYLTLYFVPSLQSDSWTLVLVAIPLVAFLFVTKMYYDKLGVMLAQNRFNLTES